VAPEQTLEELEPTVEVAHGMGDMAQRSRPRKWPRRESLGCWSYPLVFRLGQLDDDTGGLPGMEEGLPPLGILQPDADGIESGVTYLPEGGLDVRNLEGQVMGPRTAVVEEATQERVCLGFPRLKDLDPGSVGVLELSGAESNVDPSRMPRPSQLMDVARPGVGPSFDGDGDVIETSGGVAVTGRGRRGHRLQVAVFVLLLSTRPPMTQRDESCYLWAMDFRRVSLNSLADDVRSGRTGARELVAHALARIDALNDAVNAFVAIDETSALEAASLIDEMVAGGRDPGPLAGIPIGVKDLEDAAGFVTSHGSPVFAGGAIATVDSPLVARLKAAGCIVIGKTNTPELGWKGDTDNRVFGPTRNPWNLDHSPGGSSGGSAAAIASGMVPLATGSDGGGSIRIPSSCCGLSGVKPSLGRVPSGGAEPPDWHHLSTRGPMARRLADVVTALDVVVGPDPTDLRSLPRPEASWPAALDDAQMPVRVAWAPTLGYSPLDDDVRGVCTRAVTKLEALGVEVVEIEVVFEDDPIRDWLTLAMAYNLRTLAPYRGTDMWERIDPLLAASMDWAAENLTVLDVVRAEDACHRLNTRLVELFHDVRLLVTPTCAAAPPPRALEASGMINGAVDANWVRFTYPFNMTRSPAATVCAGLSRDGLPVGLQLVGPQHADLVVIRSAGALEAALGFDEIAPIGT
jgi:Asp-tRNA(Asn)/Glu-tRNA(Gln) amidotransferase A subunit family amidase